MIATVYVPAVSPLIVKGAVTGLPLPVAVPFDHS
jgi:hypothetical protein